MKKVTKIYNHFEEILLVTSLVVTVSIIFYQVVMRYVFNSAPFWTEEVARYLFIWQIWLGTSIGVRERKHIRIELFGTLLVKTGKLIQRNILEIIIILIWVAFTIFLTVSGIQLLMDQAEKGVVSVALRFPLHYAYAAVPVGCGIVTLRLLSQLLTEFKKVLKGGVA